MSDRKRHAVDLGRRSASVVQGAGVAIEELAGRADRALAEADRIDANALGRAWTDIRRPRRRLWQLGAAIAVGALATVVVGRLWRHEISRRSGSEEREWHVGREDGDWQVFDSRRDGALSRHRTQADAMVAAERSLADQGGGLLVVHALDGHPRETRHVESAFVQ